MTRLLLVLLGIFALSWALNSFSPITSFLVTLIFLLYLYVLDKRISELEEYIKKSSKPTVKEKLETTEKTQAAESIPINEPAPITPSAPRHVDAVVTKTMTAKKSRIEDGLITIITKIKNYLFTGNPIAKIGVVILFIGVAFLLKYTSEIAHFTIGMRLFGIGVIGMLMIIVGWRMHIKHEVFSHILQGCGIGLLYLPIFAAFRFYELLPPLIAFDMMLAVVILTGVLSVLQNAKSLAVLGIFAGFLSPLIISTEHGNFVLLFSYYTFLNIAILSIAWFRSWSELNLLGFVFTFLISALWGWQAYQVEYFYVTEAFLILFFLFYNAIAILYAVVQPEVRKGYVQPVITFGTPFITFTLQIGLVKHIAHGLAWSALALCIFYAVLACIVVCVHRPKLRILMESFAALAIIFGTIAIPLASTEDWTIIAWTLESLVILYVGIRQNRLLVRLFAGLLQIGSGVLFASHYSYMDAVPAVFSSFYLTAGTIGLAGLACANFWLKQGTKIKDFERDFATLLLVWGALWWYLSGIVDLHDHVSSDYFAIAVTLFFVCSSFAFWVVNEFLDWQWLRYPALTLLPIMIILAISTFEAPTIHTRDLIVTWIISFAVLYGMLYRYEKVSTSGLSTLHLISLWLFTWVLCERISSAVADVTSLPFTWEFIAWGGTLTFILFMLEWGNKIIYWPLKKYQTLYQQTGSAPICLLIFLWFLVSNLLDGNASPFIYLPIINPLDITIALALAMAIYWIWNHVSWLNQTLNQISQQWIITFSVVLIFIWLNAILLRTMHHVISIPYEFSSLWNSTQVQTALSIFWTFSSVITTFIATRIRLRRLWFVGVILIAIVVLKLFYIDLRNIGTLQRIISFISVGVLLLINGYISPMPPKRDNK